MKNTTETKRFRDTVDLEGIRARHKRQSTSHDIALLLKVIEEDDRRLEDLETWQAGVRGGLTIPWTPKHRSHTEEASAEHRARYLEDAADGVYSAGADEVAAVTLGMTDRVKSLEGARRVDAGAYKAREDELKEKVLAATPVHIDGDVLWRWQGDGEDDLETIVCPIIIEPDQLRELVRPKSEVEVEDRTAHTMAEFLRGLNLLSPKKVPIAHIEAIERGEWRPDVPPERPVAVVERDKAWAWAAQCSCEYGIGESCKDREKRSQCFPCYARECVADPDGKSEVTLLQARIHALETLSESYRAERDDLRFVLIGPLKILTGEERERLAERAGDLRRRAAEDPERVQKTLDWIRNTCAGCGSDMDEDHGLGCQVDEEIQKRAKAEQETRDLMNAIARLVDPITGKPYGYVMHSSGGMGLHGSGAPVEGWHIVFGQPYESRTLPECGERGEFTCYLYDHDHGAWTDCENISVVVVEDTFEYDVEERTAEAVLDWAAELAAGDLSGGDAYWSEEANADVQPVGRVQTSIRDALLAGKKDAAWRQHKAKTEEGTPDAG